MIELRHSLAGAIDVPSKQSVIVHEQVEPSIVCTQRHHGSSRGQLNRL